MQILQGMDPDKMIIIFPTALIAMYLVISLQKSLCERRSPYWGLILPAAAFIVSTFLAFRPLFVAGSEEMDGLFLFCIRMWLTFNIVTLVFLFPYYRQRKLIKSAEESVKHENSKDKDIEQFPEGTANSDEQIKS